MIMLIFGVLLIALCIKILLYLLSLVDPDFHDRPAFWSKDNWENWIVYAKASPLVICGLIFWGVVFGV